MVIYSFIICLKGNFVSYTACYRKPKSNSEKNFRKLIKCSSRGNTKMINIQIAYDLSVLKLTSECKSMINLRDFIALEKMKSI